MHEQTYVSRLNSNLEIERICWQFAAKFFLNI